MFRAVIPPALGLFLACTAYSQPGIYVRSDGNVGINHQDPASTLLISGSPGTLRLGTTDAASPAVTGALIFEHNLSNATDDATFCGMALRYNADTESLEIAGGCPASTTGDGANSALLSVSRSGNVGIGAAPDTFKLQVAGGIRSEEVVVETGWADFVFEEGYHLRPLVAVREFIRRNGHLPDIPPGAQIESSGLHLGDMAVRFMQKIEELTLYTLEQDEELQRQEAEIRDLQAVVAVLTREIRQLQAAVAE